VVAFFVAAALSRRQFSRENFAGFLPPTYHFHISYAFAVVFSAVAAVAAAAVASFRRLVSSPLSRVVASRHLSYRFSAAVGVAGGYRWPQVPLR
jgi:hypothetical protein